jgi:hypothetical protein
MRFLPLLLTLACVACGNPPAGGAPAAVVAPAAAGKLAPTAASTPAPAAAASAGTLADIQRMVGAASCSEASQCRTIALGARACGGPQSYMAWSTASTAEAPLRALAERYQREQQAANLASGAISTCQFMSNPGAVCQANVCRLRSGPAAGPAAQ